LLRSDAEFRSAGLKDDSLLRVDKLVTLSRNVITRRLGTIGPATEAKATAALRQTFGL
jgi:hypothetical protein